GGRGGGRTGGGERKEQGPVRAPPGGGGGRGKLTFGAARGELGGVAAPPAARKGKATAPPAANARNESSVITGIGGHGGSPLPMDIAGCGAPSMPAFAPATAPAAGTAIMPFLRREAPSHQFIRSAEKDPANSPLRLRHQ